METLVTNSYTEIYANRGGNYLTENYPTYFHTFVKRKILTGKEKPEEYKEVTAKEREKIDKSDAAWIRPPQVFIDMWNAACCPQGTRIRAGMYNEDTGYFELNDLKDITYAEALQIYQVWKGGHQKVATHSFTLGRLRTMIPIFVAGPFVATTCDMSVYETVRMFTGQSDTATLFVSGSGMFDRCVYVKKWLDVITWFSGNGENCNRNTFYFDTAGWVKNNHPFCYFRFRNTNININCQYYENIGIDSFEYVVNNRYPLTASGANPFTITVHPKVYAKLTEDADTEWTQLLAKAADKQITFATTE